MTNPYVSFSLTRYMRNGRDSAFFDYSLGTASPIQRLVPDVANRTNWFNNVSGRSWTDSNKRYWHVASAKLPQSDSLIQFRIRYLRGRGSVAPMWPYGVGVDDVHVYDLRYPILKAGVSVAGTLQTSEGKWSDVLSNDDLIAAIRPGNNGSVNWSVIQHPTTATLLGRIILDRSWTVNGDGAKGKLRLYFTDQEAEILRSKVNCNNSNPLFGAYNFELIKYGGVGANNVIIDNLQSGYTIYQPGQYDLIPYDNGYFAEIDINSGGEFFIAAKYVDTIITSFSARTGANENSVVLKWNGKGTTSYDVQVAKGKEAYQQNSFVSIKKIDGNGDDEFSVVHLVDDATEQYYYRVRGVVANGCEYYSGIQQMNFRTDGSIVIFPNPSGDGMFYLLPEKTLPPNSTLSLFNSKGQLLWKRNVATTGTYDKVLINLASGIYPAGVYHLRIASSGQSQTLKLLKTSR
ncbi:MAG: T9SS type A sorting domain-containing protein, partial [Chitinophagaceae bacterium]|nr:T9SS type A sorting domain-containing protein [Chitinophagaceae bacterium]